MCKRCTELDDKIEHYKRISTYVTDQLTLEGIAGLIKQIRAEKATLHPVLSGETNRLGRRRRLVLDPLSLHGAASTAQPIPR